MGLVEKLRGRAMEVLGRLQWLAPLVGRLAVGLLFMSTGWGKVHSLEKVTHFFEELGIPAPGINAPFVAGVELVCGTLLVLGLGTRLAALMLAPTMIVAILTAKRADLHGLFDLVGFDEFTYLCVLVMIAVIGPGSVSLDHPLARKLGWVKAP